MKILAGAVVVAALVGAWVNGQRWELKYTALQLEQSQSTVQGVSKLIDKHNAAVEAGKTKQAENEKAQQELAGVLRGLRSDVAGMHRDIADRVRSANAETLAEYATTCRAVLTAVVERGTGMAARGAGIATKADGHALDAGLAK